MWEASTRALQGRQGGHTSKDWEISTRFTEGTSQGIDLSEPPPPLDCWGPGVLTAGRLVPVAGGPD